jgi:hypothetical protein
VTTDYGLPPDSGRPNYDKTPDEAIRVTFNWASRLDGETVSSVAYELPDGLTNEAEIGTGSKREVRVSGGDECRIYRVIGKITTSGSRDLEWVKRVRVREG